MQLQTIQQKIYEVRGQQVMLDFDLAELYEVETRALKQAVKRNGDRFPPDFMFVLTNQEVDELVSQNVIPSKSHLGGALPFAFTEQGVAMLSSVLKSKKAVHMNISIMRAFVHIKAFALTHRELSERLRTMEEKYDRQFSDVYEAIHYLLQKDEQTTEQQQRTPIGF